ncbi:outer membrane beta-barrel family protein [Chitinophaga barathri]|uniref:TonB-dependent receptor n=1 Tax=Chitinophaga barathri TaxID=1647451 RepID=A0A3N4M681_9BACT|nr:outer membrane beta-barrel family protein [Chitinophaga barathri]RPD38741.1 TonB-dependent receptor [Chitinophaga barathri]
MKFLSSLLLSIVCCTAASAQFRITGTVRTGPGIPAPYATVMLLNAADSMLIKGAVCDSTGHYIMEGLATGQYLVAVSQAGFAKTYSGRIELNGHRTLPELQLKQAASLKEVEVLAKKPYIEVFADKMVLNVENNIIATGNSIFEVLKRAPGIRADQQDNLLLMGAPGTAIWIDGRPSNFTGETLTAWLKSQPADIVSKIEIITTPSSRYDAGGSSGIINIRLKKNIQQGLNGNIFLSGGMGKYPKAGSGLSLNYRKGRFNLYGNYNYYFSESYNLLTLNSANKEGGELLSENYWHPFRNSHSFRAGVDYMPDDKTTIGIIANVYLNNTNSQSEAVTIDKDQRKPESSLLTALTDRAERTGSYRLNANLQRNLDTLGSSIAVDADMAIYNKTLYEGILNDLNYERLAQLRNQAPTDLAIVSLKADYTRYFGKALKLETGVKASYVRSDNDFRYDSLLQAKWTPDGLRSNHFQYTEQIQAAYASLSYDTKKWSFQAGLRVERTDARGLSVTLDSLVSSRYTNLFPTLYVMRRLTEDQQITFSYGKRIGRPSYQTLNPFVRAIDPYTFIEGNPYLKPQLNHVLQLRHNFQNWLYTTAYYRYTEHYSESILTSDPVTRVIRNKTENIGHGVYTYLSVTIALPVTKWWEIETNAGFGYAGYTSVLPGKEFKNNGTGAEFSTNMTFTLPNKFRVQIGGDYSTAQPQGQYHNQPAYGVDFGVQKSFFKDKGSIRVNLNDAFNTRRFRANIYTDAASVLWINRWEARRLNLQLSWKFGNQQIKSARSRNTGSKEEENRVNL